MSQIVNPSNLEVIAEPTVTPVERIDEVVERATRAQRLWAGLPQHRRIPALRHLAAFIRAESETLAQVETANVGKPIGDSRGEVAMVADTFDYYAGAIDKSFGDTFPVDGGRDFTVREPIGVVTVIAPWNFPLVIAAWNIAPAHARGNAVIVKPAELTPLSVLELERIFAQVDLPDRLFQVVLGPGSTVGAALTEHPGMGKITFTGSTQTGQTIMCASAGTMKRLTLELGGKSAAVVFADADLETAASASTGAVFGNSGQDCCARSRVLVQRDVYDEFVALLVAATSTFAVGDQIDATTAMGPLVSAPHLEKVRSFLDPALDIVAPVPGPSGPGHWMAPHLVLDPPREHRIVREETSGRWWRCSRSTTSRMDRAGQRHHLRSVRVDLDPRPGPGDPGGPGAGVRVDLGQLQHVGAAADTLRRLQAIRARPRARDGRHGRLHRAQERFISTAE